MLAEPDQTIAVADSAAAIAAAESYCDGLIKGILKKAEHNKHESLGCFMLAVVCTTTVPLFITLGDGFWLSKVVPSCLSAIATGATAWLQLRKPQHLWALYRTAQRELEDHRTRYLHGLDAYAEPTERHKILAENAADIAIDLHYDWLPVIGAISVGNVRDLERTRSGPRVGSG